MWLRRRRPRPIRPLRGCWWATNGTETATGLTSRSTGQTQPGPPLYPLVRHFSRNGLAALALLSLGRMCRPRAARGLVVRRVLGDRRACAASKTADVGDSPSGGTAKAGAPASGVAGGNPAAYDVDSAERKARLAAEEAVRLKTKFDNYRFYHGALNHSDSTAKALIDSGLVTNTARPPGLSCAACSHADPSGAHFRRNTKTSP